MLGRPPAPYPDPTLETWTSLVLEQGVRGEGTMTKLSHGDFQFSSGRWATIHGLATVYRTDQGAHMVWGAKLADGRRVFCRQKSKLWQRRSEDGRSWRLGNIQFEIDEVHFSDGAPYRPVMHLTDNVFEIAMQPQERFISELRDDAVAWSLIELLREGAVCTLDGKVGWNPSSGSAAHTIGRLRGFGEEYIEFKYVIPVPLRVDRDLLVHILNEAGWRVQTEEEERRFSPRSFKK